MEEDLFQWCCKQLNDILYLDSPQDVVQYLLSMTRELDLIEYLNDLLDNNNLRHNSFIKELSERWRMLNTAVNMHNSHVHNSQDFCHIDTAKNVEKPAKENILFSVNSSSTSIKGLKNEQYQKENKIELRRTLKSHDEKGIRKKQNPQERFVPLYSSEIEAQDTIYLPGRHLCECQAQKHSLIGNCLGCGRVVCAQESSGPCLFCGNLVCTRQEQEILSRNSNKSEKLKKKLMGEKQAFYNTDKFEYAKAIIKKNKLIEHDRTSVKSKQVIDDESDYFATDTNQWLSDKDRGNLKKHESDLREKHHGSRFNNVITFDFAGRRMIDSTPTISMYDIDNAVINFGIELKEETSNSDQVNSTKIKELPKFVSQVRPPKSCQILLNVEVNCSQHRIQDREFQQMSDDGMCLSMHQPWASLFVRGIKKHEGRTWYTSHRGRLWIAATAKVPSNEEISELETFYNYIYEDIEMLFPNEYPTGCLLGCVDVIDCMPQDQYRINFPDGESSSPFVIIAENFQELHVRFPIKGKHKIWKLATDVHTMAKKGLRYIPT